MDLHDEIPGVRRRGLLIVLSSPSGAGKSTISRMLLASDPEVEMSISATTRPKRPGERDDVDYHFVGDAEFDRLIAEGDFVTGGQEGAGEPHALVVLPRAARGDAGAQALAHLVADAPRRARRELD